MADFNRWFIPILMASVCVVLLLTGAGSLSTKYRNDVIDPSISETYSASNKLSNITESMADDLETRNFGKPTDILGAILTVTVGIVRLSFGAIILVHAMIIDGGEIIGLPPIFTYSILTVIIFTLVVIIFSVLSRYNVGGE